MMKCPGCGSEDAQTLQMVFDEGTQHLDGRQTGVGVGYSPGSGMGVGVGGGKIKGTTRSVLAQKAAPPQKKQLTAGVIVAVVGFFVFIVGVSSGSGGGIAAGLIIGILIMAGGIYLAYIASQYNKNEWPALYQQWQKSWMCRKCGNIFS
jgi:hypothetical protein